MKYHDGFTLEERQKIAIDKYQNGMVPNGYMNISDEYTIGYGQIDDNGEFEFPLPCDPITGDVLLEI